jgi:hypothetical protein
MIVAGVQELLAEVQVKHLAEFSYFDNNIVVKVL